jgi:hypothetical protein
MKDDPTGDIILVFNLHFSKVFKENKLEDGYSCGNVPLSWEGDIRQVYSLQSFDWYLKNVYPELQIPR